MLGEPWGAAQPSCCLGRDLWAGWGPVLSWECGRRQWECEGWYVQEERCVGVAHARAGHVPLLPAPIQLGRATAENRSGEAENKLKK